MAEQKKVTCRTCKYSQKTKPDRKKLPPGRFWCICYRREFPGNRTCPKAEAAEAQKGVIRRRVKKPHNKNVVW